MRRNGEVLRFDYKYYLDSGDSSNLPVLQSLDTLFVPASTLLGNVQTNFDPKAISLDELASSDNILILA